MTIHSFIDIRSPTLAFGLYGAPANSGNELLAGQVAILEFHELSRHLGVLKNRLDGTTIPCERAALEDHVEAVERLCAYASDRLAGVS